MVNLVQTYCIRSLHRWLNATLLPAYFSYALTSILQHTVQGWLRKAANNNLKEAFTHLAAYY